METLQPLVTQHVPFAVIKGHEITLYDNLPTSTYSSELIKNVVFIIDNNQTLTLVGDKINFTLNFRENWDEVDLVTEGCLREGYRNIFDWIMGKKSKYVQLGWSQLKNTTPFKIIMKNYTIRYNA